MEHLEKRFEIDVPVSVAYNQWTQFEQFPEFMDGVKDVRQLDDTHVHWRASVAGVEKEWEAEITEQVPDQLIAWRSTVGVPNGGRVRFAELPGGRTCIDLELDYEPQNALEKAGDALGFVSRKVDKTVEDFRRLLERRREETGAWRGEVHGGRTQPRDAAAHGLGGAAAAGNPAGRGVAPGGAGGAFPGSTGGTPGAGGGKPGATPGGSMD